MGCGGYKSFDDLTATEKVENLREDVRYLEEDLAYVEEELAKAREQLAKAEKLAEEKITASAV